jgi:hypothetical protein
MGTLASLTLLADFGAGRATKDLTRTRDDDGRICIIPRIWHWMVQVIDN